MCRFCSSMASTAAAGTQATAANGVDLSKILRGNQNIIGIDGNN